jgi:hypothetical protein
MLFSAVFVVTTSTLAVADVDVFLSSQKQLALPSPLPTELARLVAEGRVSHTEPRLGTPTFVWAPRVTNAPNLRAAGLTPEEVARRALFTWAPLYRAQPATLAESPLLHVDDPGTGAVIVQFAHRVSGLDVFHQRLTLVFSQRLELVALSGAHAALPLRDARFKLAPTTALSLAFEGGFGAFLAADAFHSTGLDSAGAARFDAWASTHTVSLARTKAVLFPDVDAGELVPAFYVELEAAPRESTASELVGTVVSARDGRVLWRHSLTESDAYVYRVWADPTTLRPLDGPNGRATPHPTGTNDFTVLPFVTPSFVQLEHAGLSTGDPWLATGATVTTGNNVEAYADVATPDGFTAGDVRGTTTSGRGFLDAYEPTQGPGSPTQRNAGITQLFYDVNWLHDAYYDDGFDELAGNAQLSNYGRGGAEADSIRAEAQDFNGANNANMSTPADGARPRMQMFLWNPAGASSVALSPGSTLTTLGNAAFGPTSFTLSGTVILGVDSGGASVNDGCEGLTNSVAGRVVVVDRGNCTFAVKALNVQNAGGAGLLIVNNVAGTPGTMASDASVTTPITIGSFLLAQSDGSALKAALGAGPVTATVTRASPPQRDGSVDNTVVAHEWGHYLSNRLVAGLGSQQSRGMGEGWGDFVALLMTLEAGDATAPANTHFSGAYALAVWDLDSPARPTNAAYFGIRRAPYSVDFAKNGLTFGHIADGATLPAHPLASAAPANSAVHNVGEVWASALWEGTVALVRDTPRLTVDQARARMERYLVGGLKATPSVPTFTEARDGVLAVAAATDLTDFTLLAQAFARRGLGLEAVSPPRSSTTLTGVVEDFNVGNDVAFVSATLHDDDAQRFCDRDGVLDVGEQGRLRVTLKNIGVGALSGLTATVSSAVPGVLFSPATLTFPSVNPFATTSAETSVVLPATLSARTDLDVVVSFSDPSLRTAGPRTATQHFLVQHDALAAASTGDDFEAGNVWTFTREATPPSTFSWQFVELSPFSHRLLGPGANGKGDFAVMSPRLVVGSGPFGFTFSNRWSFEFQASPVIAYDGAVLELSTDDGASWVDIGASATPSYGGTLGDTANTWENPLGGRQAFVGNSAGYPAFVTTRVSLGTTYAGQTVRLRLRIATDLSTGGPGWEVDDFVFTGLSNTPLPRAVAHRGQCLNRPPIARAGVDQTVDERTRVTLSSSGSSDADGDVLTPTWTQVAGPSVALVNGVFTAPEVTSDTTLRFSLQVSDGTLSSLAADEVEVRVRQVNRVPVVNAGPDAVVDERAAFEVMGAASDLDGEALTFTWRQVSGPPALLGDATGLVLRGAAPEVTATTNVVLELRVSDGTVTVTDQVSLQVRQVNRPPTARALANGFASAGEVVVLDGFVVDPDGDATTVAWTQVEGPTVELSGPTSTSPVFTAPTTSREATLTFRLVASDAQAMSAPSDVSVVVRSANVGPSVRPGENVTVSSGQSVVLDGSASSDPEGGVLAYQWQQEGEGPRLALADETTARVTVTAPEVSAQARVSMVLYVRDAEGAVGRATVFVTVVPKAASGCGCAGMSGVEPMLLGLLLLAARRRRRS